MLIVLMACLGMVCACVVIYVERLTDRVDELEAQVDFLTYKVKS